MSSVKVSLFGKFNIAYGEKRTSIRARKVQELLIYLLIFRNHPQPRESLSEVLWADQPVAKSRKNLRQTLWHLQSALKEIKNSSRLELLIDNGWIQINLPAGFWLDTAEFERIFDLVNHKRVRELSAEDFKAMQYAVNLYKGDLLEGWYQDWCIFERERFQTMHLMLLDKLVQFCELHQKYEAGLTYGMEILRHDHAYERTHRQLMRLYFMTGNRTQALHQYASCVTALRDELGVEPSERTKRLYEQIRLDTFRPRLFAVENVISRTAESTLALNDVLNRLEQFAETLRRIESQVHQEIIALEGAFSERS